MMSFKRTSCLLAALLIPAAAWAAGDDKDLSSRHLKWLNEEVVHIITAEERDAFRQLESDELREGFINIFWEKRDPTPGTLSNEFREKHYERIEFANKNFGPRGQKNGWRTERGRIYILFGPPKERLEFPSDTLVYPLELWFYSADERVPGASFFYMMFFKRGGAGNYVIYHPQLDGPEALTWKGNFDYSDEDVMRALELLHYEIARAAISLNPLDPTGTLASEVLLGQIDSYPERAVDGSWATEFLESKGQVEVTYSFKPLQVNSISLVFSPPGGAQQLHYAFMLTPEEIEIGKYEENYFAAFEIIPSLADRDGNVIFEMSTTTEFSWSDEEFAQYKNNPIMFSDITPIIPGDYNFTLRVRNKVSRTYFLFTKSVRVPEPGPETFALSNLILNYSHEKLSGPPDLASPFRFFNIQYQPSSTNEFAQFENVHVFCQLYYPPQISGRHQVGEIRFVFNIYRGDELVKMTTHIIPQERVNPFGIVYMSRQLPIEGLSDGEYRLEVTAGESRQGRSAVRTALFSLKPPEKIFRPTVLPLHQKVNLDAAEMLFIRAQEFLAAGYKERALIELRRVNEKNPQHIAAVLKLAEVLIETDNFDEAYEKLNSVVHLDPNNRTLVLLLARASTGKGDVSKAVGYYERILFLNGRDVEALNEAAKLYRRSGQTDKARERWEKSLEVNPDQPEIREKLQSLGS